MLYDRTLTSVLDIHAPVLTRVITVRPTVPWFSDHLKILRSACRKAERVFRKSGLETHRRVHRSLRNEYSFHLDYAKKSFYTSTIRDCEGDTRKLFTVVKSLCNKKQVVTYPPHQNTVELVNDFGQFFISKIDKINANIDSIATGPFEPYVQQHFQSKLTGFKPLSNDEVRTIIKSSNTATCNLDPIPTWLLRKCLDPLLPVLTTMINLSLKNGNVPDKWKIATVTPFKESRFGPYLF
ncbi:putative RNA-directed DNA polymerase from mobile element jockey-like [Apostichopus japonicus]|uniref:Putative RNA-directed DNA polymerase from mobile element jockey-like n=1 Tax=Stichopus japonicus TaxID=307972 RepID=A0A2G8K6B2_STIJA|nr:putative RNA-directed DNA polymerase from mobile element jockey-like [Apostichopus japonicus]